MVLEILNGATEWRNGKPRFKCTVLCLERGNFCLKSIALSLDVFFCGITLSFEGSHIHLSGMKLSLEGCDVGLNITIPFLQECKFYFKCVVLGRSAILV